MKICSQCSASFHVTDEDRSFYNEMSPVFHGKKYAIPDPKLCPPCRQQRRLSFRNDRKIYKRSCDATKKSMTSMFAPKSNYTVYNQEFWWSDKYNPTDYGKDFDFSRPFFEQLDELLQEVPHISSVIINSENCDHTAFCVNSRNCYLSSRLGDSDGVLYSYLAIENSQDCLDCSYILSCQQCYETVDSQNCYNCVSVQNCKNCSDTWFSFDCIACRDCFGCVNLRNKQYCFFNKQLTKEEYFKRLEVFQSGNIYDFQEMKERFLKEKISFPHRENMNINTENTFGERIHNSKNVQYGWDSDFIEDGKYINNSEKSKDIFDADFNYYGEKTLEHISCSHSYDLLFSFGAYDSQNIIYSLFSYASKHLFACVGMKNKEYCILNKQYSKEEYEELVPKIIEHMKQTGEWGEFFPASLSPFAYNESVAQEYFPLSKQEVASKGWQWRDEIDHIPDVTKKIPAERLPDSIDEIPDDILNWAIICEKSKRPFKIVKRELDFYRKHKLPIPHLHPNERHIERMNVRNPRKLYDRKCNHCQKDIQSSYAPERKEQVYCEACYLKELY